MNNRDKILRHLSIGHNHEAGLIPASTEALLRGIAYEQDPIAVACHFCEAEEITTIPNDLAANGMMKGIDGQDAFYCHCDGCGAEGPVGDSHNQAIDKWNVPTYRTIS